MRSTLETTRTDIARYWLETGTPVPIEPEWHEARNHCWRCGDKKPLHRCHIVADCMGGPDVPSNYVLLCPECHKNGPDVPDPNEMWIYVGNHPPMGALSNVWTRVMEALAALPSGFELAAIDFDRLNQYIKTCMPVGGRMSPGTIAWCLKKSLRG